MAKSEGQQQRLDTIWHIPDALWVVMGKLLNAYDPPNKIGRRRIDARKVLDGLIYRARIGCQWNQLPAEFGNDASIHRTMQRWESLGIFDLLWALLLTKCEELDGVDWRWQAADGCLGKARGVPKKGVTRRGKHKAKECIGPNPTDRGKAGVKKSLLVEGGGGPLAICIAGANVNDATLLKTTLEAVVVERPKPTEQELQHLCLDKGYDNSTGESAAIEAGYVPHIRRIGEEKLDERCEKTHPARRWVVERTLAWLSRWRGILIRWDKKADNYLASVKLACALLWYRRCWQLGVLR